MVMVWSATRLPVGPTAVRVKGKTPAPSADGKGSRRWRRIGNGEVVHLHLVLAVLQERPARPLLFFSVAHMNAKQGSARIELLMQIAGMACRQPAGQERPSGLHRVGGSGNEEIAKR